MSREQDNKAIVRRWFTEFWGTSWNPDIVDELGAPDILVQYLLQAPHRGRADLKTFMAELRQAFPDLNVTGVADFVCDGDYVVGRWEGRGTHTGPAYCDFLVGSLPAASGQKMRFTGTTVLRVENGKIAAQIGLDDGVTALLQLGLTGAAVAPRVTESTPRRIPAARRSRPQRLRSSSPCSHASPVDTLGGEDGSASCVDGGPQKGGFIEAGVSFQLNIRKGHVPDPKSLT